MHHYIEALVGAALVHGGEGAAFRLSHFLLGRERVKLEYVYVVYRCVLGARGGAS